MNDTGLIELAIDRDAAAFKELYQRYSSLLYTLIDKILDDRKASEEILKEMFQLIWDKGEKIREYSGNPYTILVTIARNKAIDKLRRDRGGELPEYTDEYEEENIIPDLPEDIDSMDLETAFSINGSVEEALLKLTDAQQYVIFSAYYRGMRISEIAGDLNIPEKTVETKLRTAMSRFRENLLG